MKPYDWSYVDPEPPVADRPRNPKAVLVVGVLLALVAVALLAGWVRG